MTTNGPHTFTPLPLITPGEVEGWADLFTSTRPRPQAHFSGLLGQCVTAARQARCADSPLLHVVVFVEAQPRWQGRQRLLGTHVMLERSRTVETPEEPGTVLVPASHLADLPELLFPHEWRAWHQPPPEGARLLVRFPLARLRSVNRRGAQAAIEQAILQVIGTCYREDTREIDRAHRPGVAAPDRLQWALNACLFAVLTSGTGLLGLRLLRRVLEHPFLEQPFVVLVVTLGVLGTSLCFMLLLIYALLNVRAPRRHGAWSWKGARLVYRPREASPVQMLVWPLPETAATPLEPARLLTREDHRQTQLHDALGRLSAFEAQAAQLDHPDARRMQESSRKLRAHVEDQQAQRQQRDQLAQLQQTLDTEARYLNSLLREEGGGDLRLPAQGEAPHS